MQGIVSGVDASCVKCKPDFAERGVEAGWEKDVFNRNNRTAAEGNRRLKNTGRKIRPKTYHCYCPSQYFIAS